MSFAESSIEYEVLVTWKEFSELVQGDVSTGGRWQRGKACVRVLGVATAAKVLELHDQGVCVALVPSKDEPPRERLRRAAPRAPGSQYRPPPPAPSERLAMMQESLNAKVRRERIELLRKRNEARMTYPGVTNIDEARREYRRLLEADDLGGETEKKLLRLWPGADNIKAKPARAFLHFKRDPSK